MNGLAALVAAGLVPPRDAPALEAVAARYAVALTPEMAALIDPADPADPIARQFLPSPEELTVTPEERADPIGDGDHEVTPGVVHRYPDRVLLKLLHACPVYCRFCFRREQVGPGGETHLAPEAVARALDYVRAHPEIFEVIFTGGDPLMLSARRLAEIGGALGAVPHVRVVRFHSRVPVVDPARVDDALIAGLKAAGRPVWLALHANHAREFTPSACAAIARLADAGIALLGQSVLLRGVNDEAETLADLMRAFVANRVKPYYLHHPDAAPGTARFRLSVAEGQALVASLRGRVSGLCQPTYVLDIPGGHGKSPIGPGYLDGADVLDYRGGRHRLV